MQGNENWKSRISDTFRHACDASDDLVTTHSLSLQFLSMTESDDATPGTPPLMELARQLISERTRPRQYYPRGYDKTEIPRDICSAKTLGRLESGRYRGVKLGTVLALANFYRTPPPLTDHMANLVKAARARDWCREYASALDDNGWFYQQCEDNASYLAFHSFSLLPSLIQGPAYARRVRATTKVDFDAEPDWDSGIEFRMERRERWIESEKPALIVMGEAALTLDLGPEKAEIIADLRKMAALPFADVRVVPFSVGLYDLQRWDLNVLEYDGGEETVLHVESPQGSGFVSADSPRGKFFTGGFKVASGHSIEVEDFLK